MIDFSYFMASKWNELIYPYITFLETQDAQPDLKILTEWVEVVNESVGKHDYARVLECSRRHYTKYQ